MEVKVFSDGYYKISLVEPREDINKHTFHVPRLKCLITLIVNTTQGDPQI